jgi:hypothetical protein
MAVQINYEVRTPPVLEISGGCWRMIDLEMKIRGASDGETLN